MQGIETTVDLPLAAAEESVREQLAVEGFGVLTEIDVAATLKQKLGVDRAPLKILGACNPALAHQALGIDPAAALVLPCNVVLEALGDERTKVWIADPGELMPGAEFEALAGEARQRLERLAGRLGSAAA